jgi:hypothetical protein
MVKIAGCPSFGVIPVCRNNIKISPISLYRNELM